MVIIDRIIGMSWKFLNLSGLIKKNHYGIWSYFITLSFDMNLCLLYSSKFYLCLMRLIYQH